MDITKFDEKLNKVDGNTYVIEEVVTPVSGLYEAELAHDNVNLTTLNVYTGSQLTGDRINTYTTSTPSLAPWKTVIKIYSNLNPLYISYETSGDTVEADDINNLQDAVDNTQKALNDETNRAANAEKILTDNLNAEIVRAKGSENTINSNLNAEITRAKASENTIINTINSNKPNWDDKYTKNEIDNKISAVVTSLDYKEHVSTFAELANTYPNPQDGWTVSVDADNITYKYNGSSWIPISANSIPLASSTIDGKMSKQDKIDHDDMVNKRHTHSNKGILDVITQTLLDTWNAAYTHISDTIKHITSTERTNWNTAYTNNHTHSNKSIIDTITQALIDAWNSAYSHISDTVKHITSDERTNWNNGVSAANSAKSAIDNLQIGGRNLLLNSSFSKDLTSWSGTGTIVNNTLEITGVNTSTRKTQNVNVLPLTQYTFSIEVVDQTDTGSFAVFLWEHKSDGTTTATYKDNNHNFTQTGRVSYTITTQPDCSIIYVLIQANNGKTIHVRKAKLEVGNRATDWTPAPEDIQSQLDNKSDINHTHDDRYYTETESDNKFATISQISQAGYGDMLKSTYDKDNDGIVDSAGKLSTARKINGINFDGSGDIAINAIPSGKTIDGNFIANFRSQVKGDTNSGDFLASIRNDTANVDSSPQYGSGIGFGRGDTHGYLYMNYASAVAFIGAGNSGKLNWTKQLAFIDSNVASATKATQDSDGKQINSTYVKKGMTWNDLEGI